MKLHDALDRATVTMRRVKTEHVARARADASLDILTFVECYRGDQLVATIAHPPQRDTMMGVLAVAARGFAPDVITASMETYYAQVKSRDDDNPHTGKPWESGDLQQVAEAGGDVDEAIVTTAINRAGDTATTFQPYRITERVVEWEDAEAGPRELAVFTGPVARFIAQTMNAPVADQFLAALGLNGADLGEEQHRAAVDAATLLALQQVPGVPWLTVMIASEPGSVRDQTLRRFIKRSDTFNPDDVE